MSVPKDPGQGKEPKDQKSAKAGKEGRGAKEAKEAKEAEGQGEEESGGGRLSRWRFSKKKDMPGGLWLKCENCGTLIYKKELEERGRVCPSCSFHFTLPARERLAALLDAGTWEERFADLSGLDRLGFTDSVPYAEKLQKTAARLNQQEALLCGFGAIDGRRMVLAVLDFSFLGGSMGEVVGEKFALACDLARQEGLPLVCFTSSGGARMHEGALSLMQMAKTCAALASLNEAGGFSVCVMTHPTTGGVTASFASVCDITLAEPGALIGFAGPRVIAATLKQELPKGFQRAEFLVEKGMLDNIVPRSELRNALTTLIDFANAGRERRQRRSLPGDRLPVVPPAPTRLGRDASGPETSQRPIEKHSVKPAEKPTDKPGKPGSPKGPKDARLN
jgi:acetyl-CoA carboxylase carboxyl transferase subunit beta